MYTQTILIPKIVFTINYHLTKAIPKNVHYKQPDNPRETFSMQFINMTEVTKLRLVSQFKFQKKNYTKINFTIIIL